MQPPSGGCVLKPFSLLPAQNATGQPPSGGCVLKQRRFSGNYVWVGAAASARLCVETLPTTC